MSEGAACTSVLYAVKKYADNPKLRKQGDVFFARAEFIGITPAGRPIPQNDLLTIRENFRRFEAGEWDGIEMSPTGDRIGEARDYPQRLLSTVDPKREPRRFELTVTKPMGTKRGKGEKSFVLETRQHAVKFYRDIVQSLRPWRPSPPKLPDEESDDSPSPPESTLAPFSEIAGGEEEET